MAILQREFVAPPRTARRMADVYLDQYMKAPVGSPAALELLAKARAAARNNVWELPDRDDAWRPADTYRQLRDLSGNELDQVCEMYQNDMQIQTIVERFNVSRNTIVRLLELRGIQRRRRRVVDAGEVRRLRNDGLTIKQIAAQLECHETTVMAKLDGRPRRASTVSGNG